MERFLPTFNQTFGRAPTDPASAFVPVTAAQFEPILCHEAARGVARDNTVTLDRVVLQIAKQRGRRTSAGLPVLVRRHLDSRHTVWWARRCLGRYDAEGHPPDPPARHCLGLIYARPVTSRVKSERSDHLSTTGPEPIARGGSAWLGH